MDVQPPAQKGRSAGSVFGIIKRFRQKPTPAVLQPQVFGQGVTGADLSLPIFDGTSTHPDDYLIEFDSDSMETAPDVRSYFHWVGQVTREPSTPPVDLDERKVYDSRLVRQGREYLQAARARGHGLYMSADRDLLSHNIPGGPWYRMPLTGIVDEFLQGQQQPTKDEGGFMLDPDGIVGAEDTNITRRDNVLLTNIRSTIWWDNSLRPGVVPGTRGWDSAIYGIYCGHGHPASVLWSELGRGTIIDAMRMMDGKIFQAHKATEIIDRDWHRKEDDYDPNFGLGSDSEDEDEDVPTTTENHLIFDPAFLAEIQPAKSRGFFKRGK